MPCLIFRTAVGLRVTPGGVNYNCHFKTNRPYHNSLFQRFHLQFCLDKDAAASTFITYLLSSHHPESYAGQIKTS